MLFLVRRMDLGYNQFFGKIPATIYRNTFIENLNLENNSLTGTIPPEIAHLGLRELDLSHNSLEGPIPEQLGSVATLRFLNVESNELINLSLPNTFTDLYRYKEVKLAGTGMKHMTINSRGEVLPE